MEEYIKDKSEEKKPPGPTIKQSGGGFTITPVSPPTSSKPTTPIPKVSAPPPLITPVLEHAHALEHAQYKGKKDITTFFLFLAVIFIIFSLWVLISIGLDRIPNFWFRFF